MAQAYLSASAACGHLVWLKDNGENMLDLKFIRDNKDIVKESLKNRGSKLDIDELLRLDEEHRKILTESKIKKEEQVKNSLKKTLMVNSPLIQMR